ncbi:hypothetical protein H9P43_007189 [Blastocladiella emersonii ATCC 22665]|nr:hypothetical protein H9P43_007189 [Blastocladiella emersonii ATCC 22665]
MSAAPGYDPVASAEGLRNLLKRSMSEHASASGRTDDDGGDRKRSRRDDDRGNGERSSRTADRGDRGDRERGYERSDRDHRERAERSDRGDRADRGDRDRGDRGDRERPRHRDSDRSSGYDRGGDRDRDYDRSHRRRSRERDDYRRRSRSRDRYGGPRDYPRDDWGGGHGGGGGGRGRGGRNEPELGRDKGFGYSFGGSSHAGGRYRSPSPPPGTVPLDKRPRRLKLWDQPPPGFENTPAEAAKETGDFLLPSHKAVLKMQPGHLLEQMGALKSQRMHLGGDRGPPPFMTRDRQARRIYFGNLPRNVAEADLLAFVNREMERNGWNASAISASFGGERNFAFIEFREPVDAAHSLFLDGVSYGGNPLKIKRPKDYVPTLGADEPLIFGPAGGSNVASTNPDKLFIGGIPRNLQEDQVRELLAAFGELRTFNLIMDNERRESKGYAFCEFEDSAIADVAIESLNGMEIGDRRLVVQRAGSSGRAAAAPRADAGAMDHPGGAAAAPNGNLGMALACAGGIGELSRVMLLLNLAPFEEIRNQQDYEDLLADVRDECAQHGRISQVVIPRPAESPDAPPALVQVFVAFEDKFDCQTAMRNIAGRAYRGRTVVAAYYPEDRWSRQDYYGSTAATPAPAAAPAASLPLEQLPVA